MKKPHTHDESNQEKDEEHGFKDLEAPVHSTSIHHCAYYYYYYYYYYYFLSSFVVQMQSACLNFP